eukprot:jgi/Bigna1/81105/fgenesh1_pg.77_\
MAKCAARCPRTRSILSVAILCVGSFALGGTWAFFASNSTSKAHVQPTAQIRQRAAAHSGKDNNKDSKAFEATNPGRDEGLYRLASDRVVWLPRHENRSEKICVFSVAVGRRTLKFYRGIEMNANWANLHGHSFTLFNTKATQDLHPTWEKVAVRREGGEGGSEKDRGPLMLTATTISLIATKRRLRKELTPIGMVAATKKLLREMEESDINDDDGVIESKRGAMGGSGLRCPWILYIDADAIVAGIDVNPFNLLTRMETQGGGATSSCPVGLREQGPASPFPCLINSGVYFIRNVPESHTLVDRWFEKHAESDDAREDPYWEQEALNILKEEAPSLIEVVGGQVMNTHSSFHHRFHSSQNAGVAFDIALRVSTGFEPSIEKDARLNHTLYQNVAMEVFGAKLSSKKLIENLRDNEGECSEDPKVVATAFICHAFARPLPHKRSKLHSIAHKHSAKQ